MKTHIYTKKSSLAWIILKISDGSYFDDNKREEFDTLVINESRQLIVEIEVKKYLGPYDPKPGRKKEPEDPSIKAGEQLENRKELIHKLFGKSIQGKKWNYVSACAYQTDKRKSGQHVQDKCQCADYVVETTEIPELIKTIERKFPFIDESEKYDEDFICFAKYLLFCLPCQKLNVRSNEIAATSSAVEEAGCVDNIILWMPTRNQKWAMLEDFLGKTFHLIICKRLNKKNHLY